MTGELYRGTEISQESKEQGPTSVEDVENTSVESGLRLTG